MTEAEQLMLRHLRARDHVYVFPSEVAADWNLRHLLSAGEERALSRDQCISWDRFKELTLRAPDGRRAANDLARALFLDALLTENSRRPVFQSLIRPDCAASSAAYSGELKRTLPLVGRTEALLKRAGDALPAGKRRDLALLAERYRRFLTEAGLFEPDDRPAVFEPGTARYLVFHPEVIEDWETVSPALAGSPAAQRAGAGEGNGRGGTLSVFPGVEDEINWLMNRIHALLEAGVSASEIVITAAGWDELALPLTDSARRYDIRLRLNAGRPLLAYPGVNWLDQAARAVDSGFGLPELAALVFNRALPWQEPAAAAGLIRFGLEHNCLKNYAEDDRPFDLWEHRLKRGRPAENGETLLPFYRRLRDALADLCRADSFAGVKKAATKFRAVFLEAERFGEAERRPLELALDLLDELADGHRRLPLPPPASPFALWLDRLGETRYVPPSKEAGVAVYPYRVSAGIRPEHHFIINASEEATRAVIPPFPFLSVDEEARLGLKDQDLSEAFLSLYLASGREVTVSYARSSFGKIRLPPPFFVKAGALRGLSGTAEADSYAAEAAWFSGGRTAAAADRGLRRPFSLQREGLAAAARTLPARALFTHAPLADSVLRQRLIESLSDGHGRLALSPSALETFAACPFRFLLEQSVGLTERENEFAQDRPLWYGDFIHRVFERFFRGLAEGGRGFEGRRLDRHREEIARAAEEEAARWENSRSLPLPPLWRTLRRGIERGLAAFLERTAEAFGDFEIAAAEKTLTSVWEKEGITLSGKIDLVGRGADGLFLIDYKKNSVPKRSDISGERGEPGSFQIPCYLLLAQAEGEPAASASYYSFQKEKYEHVVRPGAKAYFSSAEMEPVLAVARRSLGGMAERIRAGDYSIRRRAAACSHCPLRPVCRNKYFLRLED